MPGPPPKASGRQRTNSRSSAAKKSPAKKSSAAAGLVALPSQDVTSGAVDVPSPPAGLLKASRERWASFWRSPVAAAVDRDADLGRLVRWIQAVDEYERLAPVFRKSPLVKGSTGQPRLNPLRDRLNDLERVLASAEEAFGMTPISRLRLGIAVGEATKSLESLIEEADAAYREDDDPRVGEGPVVIVGEVVEG